jgi:hypothetical protein
MQYVHRSCFRLRQTIESGGVFLVTATLENEPRFRDVARVSREREDDSKLASIVNEVANLIECGEVPSPEIDERLRRQLRRPIATTEHSAMNRRVPAREAANLEDVTL